ncbi:MAG: hypothetical protein JRC90_11720 [Deltaproteobacteria bacterium]|nr:hypothetical protein [Deltaproteobacteria bacterium]
MYQYNYQNNIRDLVYWMIQKNMLNLRSAIESSIRTGEIRYLIDALYTAGGIDVLADIMGQLEPSNYRWSTLRQYVYNIANAVEQFMQGVQLPPELIWYLQQVLPTLR